MFEPKVFRKNTYCIEESTCDFVGTFRRLSQSFGARDIVPPCPDPRYDPGKANNVAIEPQTNFCCHA